MTECTGETARIHHGSLAVVPLPPKIHMIVQSQDYEIRFWNAIRASIGSCMHLCVDVRWRKRKFASPG
jgi:hypothetical protein